MSEQSAALPTLSAAGAASSPLATRNARRRSRLKNLPLIAGAIILGVVLIFVIVAPMVSPYETTKPDLAGETFAPPSWSHPLGTDNFGRDIFTRIAEGGRIDLEIAVFATLVTVIVGTTIGLCSGYFGGWADTILMRLVDVVFAFPFYVLVVSIIAILGASAFNVFIAIWAVGWVAYARIVRGETLVARRLEYVEAARVIGLSHVRVLARHVLPNVVSQAIIFSMADAIGNIVLASSLSFLGLGVQPPRPEWGLMIAEGRDFFLRDWQLTTFPGFAILVVGAGFSLLGDGLAEALRPRR
jgi:peptide/nickel transport system permease protein